MAVRAARAGWSCAGNFPRNGVNATFNLTVNGTVYPVSVWGTAKSHDYRTTGLEGIVLNAGTNNTLVITSTVSPGYPNFKLDQVLVSHAGHLAQAAAHRTVLGQSQANQDNLLAYLLQLDERDANGNLPSGTTGGSTGGSTGTTSGSTGGGGGGSTAGSTTGTLLFQWKFDETGVTAPSSASAATLNLQDAAGASSDLHGAAGSGVAGLGRPFDNSASTALGGAGGVGKVTGVNLGSTPMSQFTITGWLKNQQTASGWGRILVIGPSGTVDGGGANSIKLETPSANPVGFPQFQMNGGSSYQPTDGLPLTVNSWVFFAMTYDDAANTLTFYRGTEGGAVTQVAQTTSYTDAAPTFGTDATIFIGNRDDRQRAFDGQMDDFRLFGDTLSAAQLEAVRRSALSSGGTTGGSTGTGTTTGGTTTGSLLAHEPFNYTSGTALHALNGGVGWGNAWGVQNLNTTVPGYSVESSSLLAFSTLAKSANYSQGGIGYLSSGRQLDLSGTGPFAAHLANGLIGAPGTTLYLSFMMRKDQSNNERCFLGLSPNFTAWSPEPPVAAGFFDSSSVSGGTRYWSLRLDGTTYHLSTVPVTTGQTALLVVRIDFGATNTVKLWVNPSSLGGAEPTPNLTATTTTSLAFQSLVHRLGSNTGQAACDEIRLGTSFAAVTPTQ